MIDRGKVLCTLNTPECEETLAFKNRLTDYLFFQRAKWEAKFVRLGRPPSERERNEFEMWADMIEDHECNEFYGVPD
jgi:hypothetical protein